MKDKRFELVTVTLFLVYNLGTEKEMSQTKLTEDLCRIRKVYHIYRSEGQKRKNRKIYRERS